MKQRDELMYVRREETPRFARVWYDVIDDPRLKTKAALTLYLALARIADFTPHNVHDIDDQPTGQRGYNCGVFPGQTHRSRIMRAARIGNPRTFYAAMDALIGAGWVRRDYCKDNTTLTTTFYRENWPPVYTLLRPKNPPSPK